MATASPSKRSPTPTPRLKIRDLGLFALVPLGLTLLALILDAQYRFSGNIRATMLAIWVVGSAIAAWYWLARPTARQGDEVPWSRVVVPLALAYLVLNLAALHDGVSERFRRFIHPWVSTRVEPPGRWIVPAGTFALPRGDSVVLTAYLERSTPAPGPSLTLLRRTSPGSAETRDPMEIDANGVGSYLVSGVTESFEYAVESGTSRSPWYVVQVADPVRLAQPLSMEVIPPSYAVAMLGPRKTVDGDLIEVLAYSQVRIPFRLTRPAIDVSSEWQLRDRTLPQHRTTPSVTLASDRTQGHVEFTVPSDGVFTLTMVGEHGLSTEQRVVIRTVEDTPPRFDQVAGLIALPCRAKPGTRIPIAVQISDDFRVEQVALETVLRDPSLPSRLEVLNLSGTGTTRVDGVTVFTLPESLKPGETIYLRLRATDNRLIPTAKLFPQISLFPPTGWAAITIDSQARSLAEQLVLLQQEQTAAIVGQIRTLAQEARQELRQVQETSPAEANLPTDQTIRLRIVREKLGEIDRALDTLVDELALIPERRPVARDYQAVRAGNLATAFQEIDAALTTSNRSLRELALARSGASIDLVGQETNQILEQMRNQSARAIERERLLELSREQRALAQDVADPQQSFETLLARQKTIATDFHEIVDKSARLTPVRQSADSQRTRRWTEELMSAVRDQQWLNQSKAAFLRAEMDRRLGPLRTRQTELATRITAYAQEQGITPSIAGIPGLDLTALAAARRTLEAGQVPEALTELEKLARELDRLSTGYYEVVLARTDLRETLRQLLRWQEDLIRRSADPAGQTTPFSTEERLIALRLRRVMITNYSPAHQQAQNELDRDLQQAIRGYEDSTRDRTDLAKKVAESMKKLIALTPTREQRAQRTREQIERLRKEIDSIGREAEEVVRTVDPRTQSDSARAVMLKKLEEIANRAMPLVSRVRELDLGEHERIRTMLTLSLQAAIQDLRDGYPLDVPLSWQEARRWSERLKQAHEGLPTIEDQVAEVRRMLDELARIPFPAMLSRDDYRTLETRWQELAKRLMTVIGSESAGPTGDIRESLTRFDRAIRERVAGPELTIRLDRLRTGLERMTARLAGEETPLARLQILTKEATTALAGVRPAELRMEAPRLATRWLEELEPIRVGQAQAAKKRVLETLVRIRSATEPDRAGDLIRLANDQLRSLESDMARLRDRTAPLTPVGPPRPFDYLLTRSGPLDHWPVPADIETARQLAMQVRQLRDAIAQVIRGPESTPAETTPDRLAALATQIERLLGKLKGLREALDPEPSLDLVLIEDSERALRQVRDAIRAGHVDLAKVLMMQGTQALERLTALPTAQPEGGSAKEMIRDLSIITKELDQVGRDPAAIQIRQLRQQEEIRERIERLQSDLPRLPLPDGFPSKEWSEDLQAWMRSLTPQTPTAAAQSQATILSQLDERAQRLRALSAPQAEKDSALTEMYDQARANLRVAIDRLTKKGSREGIGRAMQQASEAIERLSR